MFLLSPQVEFNPSIPLLVRNFLRALAYHCGATTVCWPSQARIGLYMGREIRSVQRAEKWAKELGLVRVTLRPGHSSLYEVLCMDERPPAGAQVSGGGAASNPQKSIHNPPNVTPITDQLTNKGPLTKTLPNLEKGRPYPQETQQPANNGVEELKPKKNHPAMVRLIAEDLAEGLHSKKSFKWFLKLAWRVSEEILREAMAWVRQEYHEGKCMNPAGLFTWRLRIFYQLPI